MGLSLMKLQLFMSMYKMTISEECFGEKRMLVDSQPQDRHRLFLAMGTL